MNRSKKIAITALSTMLLAVTFIGGSLAYFTDAKETDNTITMGHVDIELNEPRFQFHTNGALEMKGLIPTQRVVKDPTITVSDSSERCYLRVKITVDGFEGVQTTMDDGSIKSEDDYIKEVESLLMVRKHSLSDKSADDKTIWDDNELVTMQEFGWVKAADGYYYYCGDSADSRDVLIKAVCESGNVVPVFSQFTVPMTWKNDLADVEFDISIQAEAIQADSFTPITDNGFITAWKYSDGTDVQPEKYPIQ